MITMKKVFIFSLLVFLGWCFGCPLCAQNCKPSPACKAICAELKADAAQADLAPAAEATAQHVAYKKSCSGASAKSGDASVQVIPAGLFAPGTATATSNKSSLICNPENCDPTKCDWSKCDLSKCKPASCKPGGAKAAVRL